MNIPAPKVYIGSQVYFHSPQERRILSSLYSLI